MASKEERELLAHLKKLANFKVLMLRDDWKQPQKMAHFHVRFNSESNSLIFKVIHSDSEAAVAVHVYTATACKGMRRRNPNTGFNS